MRNFALFVIGAFAFVWLCAVVVNGLNEDDDRIIMMSSGNKVFPTRRKTDEKKNEGIRDGKCGDNLSWNIIGDTLTIEGTGGMDDFLFEDTPWITQSSSLFNVVVKEGVTSLGNYAFYRCRCVSHLNLPSSLISIGFEALGDLDNLTSIEIEPTNPRFRIIDGVLFDVQNHSLVKYPPMNHATNYTIPNDVTSIRESAFDNSYYLTQLVIPFGVESIGEYAFDCCWSLPRISLPSSLTYISNHVFANCHVLLSIEVDPENKNFTSIDGVLFDIQSHTLVRYPPAKNDTAYTIPNGVKSIGDDSFLSCGHLTDVYFPTTVTSVGTCAFFGCENLTEARLPSSVSFIGSQCFDYCSSLTSVTIPVNVSTIYFSAFAHCNALTSFVVEPGNKRFSAIDGALIDMEFHSLIRYPAAKAGTSYTVPSSVFSIEAYAFADCLNLVTVVLPESLSYIGYSAFDHCSNLTDVFIPGSVTSIGDRCFESCEKLTYITIPEVYFLGEHTFLSCTGLEKVFYQGSQEYSAPSTFEFCDSLSTICVSPDYESPEFCGRTVTRDECREFSELFNHCFKANYRKGEFIQEKRINATRWESRTNGCFECYCDNESGPLSLILCNKSDNRECLNGKCVDSDASNNGKWMVEMDVDGVKAVNIQTSEILYNVYVLTGIEMNKVSVGMDIDDDGFIVKIVLYVDDEKMALTLSQAVKGIEKGETCQYGVLCRAENVRISKNHMEEISNGHSVHINVICLMALLAIEVFTQTILMFI